MERYVVRKESELPAWLGGEGPEIYYGELHRHSALSTCQDDQPKSSPPELYQWLHEEQEFDFAALADHCFSLIQEPDLWPLALQAAADAEQPGRFAALPAFEWTSSFLGHRNVFFARHGADLPLAVAGDDPQTGSSVALDRILAEALPRSEFLISLDHPTAVPYQISLDRPTPNERLIEIYTGPTRDHETLADAVARGDESLVRPGTTVQDALVRGMRLAFTSTSDAHFAEQRTANYTAAYARSLDCAGIFEALAAGRTLAGRGVRSAAHLTVNGFAGGETIAFDLEQIDDMFPLEVRLSVRQPEAIRSVRIVRMNHTIREWTEEDIAPDDVVHFEATVENPMFHGRRHTNCQNTCFYAVIRYADESILAASPVHVAFRPDR